MAFSVMPRISATRLTVNATWPAGQSSSGVSVWERPLLAHAGLGGTPREQPVRQPSGCEATAHTMTRVLRVVPGALFSL